MELANGHLLLRDSKFVVYFCAFILLILCGAVAFVRIALKLLAAVPCPHAGFVGFLFLEPCVGS